MTTQQIIVVLFAYSIALAAAVYFTRPTWRRAAGAVAGGAAAGWVLLGAIALGNAQGWWRVPIPATPGALALFYLAGAISCSPIYLITWRVALRFGWRGLAVCLIFAAIIGPPRDYLIAAMYPEWMVFAPGVAPVFADAATYFGFVGLGHAVMRLVAGPARRDQKQ
jgi:hypothetical protein